MMRPLISTMGRPRIFPSSLADIRIGLAASSLQTVNGIAARDREKPRTFNRRPTLPTRTEGVLCDSFVGPRHHWAYF